jgi:hypothetical protein
MLLSHAQTNSRRAWSLPRVRLKILEQPIAAPTLALAEEHFLPVFFFTNYSLGEFQ